MVKVCHCKGWLRASFAFIRNERLCVTTSRRVTDRIIEIEMFRMDRFSSVDLHLHLHLRHLDGKDDDLHRWQQSIAEIAK